MKRKKQHSTVQSTYSEWYNTMNKFAENSMAVSEQLQFTHTTILK